MTQTKHAETTLITQQSKNVSLDSKEFDPFDEKPLLLLKTPVADSDGPLALDCAFINLDLLDDLNSDDSF